MALVLVIDDDPLTCDLIRYVLMRSGIEAVTVNNTLDAWEHLKLDRFDLIIVDIFLPQTDGVAGIEFIDQIRANAVFSTLPIVALTAAPSPQIEAQAKAAGCDVFMHKPFVPSVLKEQIKQLLDA